MFAALRRQVFCARRKTLKWAGSACPFEPYAGPPQNQKVLWGASPINE